MDFQMTFWLAAAFLAIAVFAGWRGARPSNPVKGPRLTPWRPLMVAAAVGALMMIVHLVNLMGVKTGR